MILQMIPAEEAVEEDNQDVYIVLLVGEPNKQGEEQQIQDELVLDESMATKKIRANKL